MRGDFSRNSDQPSKPYTRVLQQQGRVQLDADANEQTAILLRLMRRFIVDLVGPRGTPAAPTKAGFPTDFQIALETEAGVSSLNIAAGTYYLRGVRVSNPEASLVKLEPELAKAPCLVYLEAWEREVNPIEDPETREVALGVADTSWRAKVVWEVKTHKFDKPVDDKKLDPAAFDPVLDAFDTAFAATRLKAFAKKEGEIKDPCRIPPDARFRGPENQLYRVEIHDAGNLADKSGKPTFKWSRDNASFVFPVVNLAGPMLTLGWLGRDARSDLEEGQWIELVDPTLPPGPPAPLLQIEKVYRDTARVKLSGDPKIVSDGVEARGVYLRRWDQHPRAVKGPAGASPGVLAVEEAKLIPIENGLSVEFQTGGSYRPGDFWLIPARTATGDLDWPKDATGPLALPPHGVIRWRAPLAYLNAGAVVKDLRTRFALTTQDAP